MSELVNRFTSTNRDSAIAAFHAERGIALHFGCGRRDDGEFCVRLCIADPADAAAFQKRFGGERVVPTETREQRQ